ncbi:hypothetical protein [Desulfosporosinus sp. SB140]|uniref:hypothetical protein n=1 Tax=Desulfosporosinus paludis TaxID=3115649 RepID=UPI003890CD36
MNREQVLLICENLIDQVTALKGFIQLNHSNKKIDQSFNLLQEIDNLEKVVKELINQLLID